MADLIVIDITENENILLDGSLNQKTINGNGLLLIKNPSSRSRLWNLACDLKEIVNTNIETRELPIGILNPVQDYKVDYEIQNLKQSTLLLNEVFDSQRKIASKVNKTFLFSNNNVCSVKIELTNPLDIPISNIKVVREIPDIFQDIEVLTPSIGTAGIILDQDKNSLNWDIVTLEGNQTVHLEITFNVNPQERESISLGALGVTYLVNNYKLTMLEPEIRGLTDSMSGIDRDEGVQPGLWNCNVEFINDSDFQVRLEDAKVSHKIITGEETVVSQTPNRLLNPDESWNFDFQVESKDVPELNSAIEFSPLYVFIKRVIGEIKKEATIYPVLSATVDKMINPPEMLAYANTDISVENLIVNNGTSPIEYILISDKIPKDFSPPLLNQVKILLGDIDISSRTDFTNKLLVEPEDQNPDLEHQLKIELVGLSSEFLPNKKLTISYPTTARNPRPPTEILYKTPIEIQVNSPIGGNMFTAIPEIEPEFKIKYAKRQLKTLKSIKPGISEGEFSISVRIQNKGSVELENIIIKEKIPPGFELSQIEIENYEIIKSSEFSELQVKFSELKANESINLIYNCAGQGDYPRFEPEVIVLGRDAEPSQNIEYKEPKNIEGNVSELDLLKKSIINDLFTSIYRKIEQSVTGNALGDFIENMRDDFPPGPVKHQFMQFAKEIKSKSSEKLIIGSLRDEIMSELKQFQEKYF